MTTLTLNELTRDVLEFLKFKRTMGYSYRRGEFTLASLERFAKTCIPHGARGRAKISLEDTARAWLSRTENRKGNTVALELTVVRQLCLHRRRRDPHGFVPEQAWAPKTELPFLPYIFSRQEVHRLLLAADHYRHRNVDPVLMRTLLLILYCTGLRFGEAVRLRLPDVNLGDRVFFIRESKGRSRWVAFGDDLAREIKRWLTERDRILSTRGTKPLAFIASVPSGVFRFGSITGNSAMAGTPNAKHFSATGSSLSKVMRSTPGIEGTNCVRFSPSMMNTG